MCAKTVCNTVRRLSGILVRYCGLLPPVTCAEAPAPVSPGNPGEILRPAAPPRV